MAGPANPVGVAFAVMMAVAMVVSTFAIGFDERTRYGVPYWLLALVSVGGFLGVAIQAWRTPPPHRGDNRSIQLTIAALAACVLAPLAILLLANGK